jgi:threonine/homoserine/homoserine lactone efflux protein
MDGALATLGAFFLTSLAIEITPGPNMAYLALVGVSRGRAAGLMAVVGVALGLLLLGAVVGVGLGSLILENRLVYQTLRWGGAAYLFWLAYDAWREGRVALGDETMPPSLWLFFRRGLITNLLNPKAAVFYVAVMPAFIVEGRSLLWQTTWLVLVYALAATLVHVGIVLASGTLEPLFRRPELRRRAGILSALALAAVAIWLLLKTAG